MKKDRDILKAQYDQYIYPNPVQDIKKEILEKGKIFTSDPNFYWHKLWPEKKYMDKGLNILVAGCGSDQAAISAFLNPNHYFFAADLSIKSIEHHEKLKTKYNLKNLKLYCEDFRKLNFSVKFDYIISTGVIHHLKEPESALKYFENHLKEDGVIYLMVYGDKQRYGLNQIKKIFNKLQLSQDSKSIKIAKQIIERLNPNHPAKIFAKNSDDMNYDAGIVDLLLHKQETFYEISDLIQLLKNNKLIIKNTVDENLTGLTKYFLFDQDIVNLIRSINPDEKIKFSQLINWNDFKINLILSKESQIKNSIHYNKINIDELYLSYSNFKDYNFENNIFKIINKEDNSFISFQLSKDIKNDNLKEILKGKNKIFQLIDKNENSKNFFNILIENSFVEYSKYPFVNSLDILEKNLIMYK